MSKWGGNKFHTLRLSSRGEFSTTHLAASVPTGLIRTGRLMDHEQSQEVICSPRRRPTFSRRLSHCLLVKELRDPPDESLSPRPGEPITLAALSSVSRPFLARKTENLHLSVRLVFAGVRRVRRRLYPSSRLRQARKTHRIQRTEPRKKKPVRLKPCAHPLFDRSLTRSVAVETASSGHSQGLRS